MPTLSKTINWCEAGSKISVLLSKPQGHQGKETIAGCAKIDSFGTPWIISCISATQIRPDINVT
jgi:hypothetical protein